MNTEFFIKQFDENKQISMTGSRALILLVYLMDGPKSFEEIRDFFLACGIVTKEYSVDTIRIDLNTLKIMGCEITKATKRTNHKYGLISHPFKLKLTEAEISLLKSLYKKVAKTATPGKLVQFHKFFQRIASFMDDNDELKEMVLGISIFKSNDISILEELVANELHVNKITISYFPPSHDAPVNYDVSIESIGLRNGKLYIFCYNHTLNTRSFLKVSRIKGVVSKMFDRTIGYGFDTVIKFKLENYKDYVLEENEIIVEEKDDYAIIEGYYFNEFIGVQRILSFASDCTVLEPDEMKEIIIDKLKEMRSVYE